jgi:flavin-binding protein dodecin
MGYCRRVDDPVERALEKANARLAGAAEDRVTPAAVDAALERARAAIDSLAQASAELQEGLPGAIQDGLQEHFRPSARHIAAVRALMNQTLSWVESLDLYLLLVFVPRVDDLALLVDLIASGWQSVNDRLTKLDEALQPRLRSVS